MLISGHSNSRVDFQGSTVEGRGWRFEVGRSMFDDQSSRVEVRRTFDVGRSRFEVRHSRFEVVLVGGAPVHWWTFEGPGSRVQVRGSTFQVRVRARWGALVRGSRVNGRGSRVEGRGSTFDIRHSSFDV